MILYCTMIVLYIWYKALAVHLTMPSMMSMLSLRVKVGDNDFRAAAVTEWNYRLK
jgi:hypothetical protein